MLYSSVSAAYIFITGGSFLWGVILNGVIAVRCVRFGNLHLIHPPRLRRGVITREVILQREMLGAFYFSASGSFAAGAAAVGVSSSSLSSHEAGVEEAGAEGATTLLLLLFSP